MLARLPRSAYTRQWCRALTVCSGLSFSLAVPARRRGRLSLLVCVQVYLFPWPAWGVGFRFRDRVFQSCGIGLASLEFANVPQSWSQLRATKFCCPNGVLCIPQASTQESRENRMTAPWAERCGCLCPTCPTLRGRLERSWHPERAINDLQIQRFLSKKLRDLRWNCNSSSLILMIPS